MRHTGRYPDRHRRRHEGFCAILVSGGTILGRPTAFDVTSARYPHRGRPNVPLNRPALALGSGPRSVQDARRWVVGTCQDIGRDDLVECAELGVSELVTNALLHARAADHGAGARHPRAPAGRGPRRLAPTCPSLPHAGTPPDEADAAAHLRPRARASSPARPTPGASRSRTTARSSGSRPPTRSPSDAGAEGAVTGRHRRASSEELDDPAATWCDFSIRGVPVRTTSLPAGTTASCAARSGCSPSPTRTTTRWPRTSPTCSARWTSQLAARIGDEQIEAALAPGRGARPTCERRHCRAGSPSAVDRFIELLDLADEFCRGRAPAVAGPHARAARVPELVPRRVRPPGRRRGAAPLGGRAARAIARPAIS